MQSIISEITWPQQRAFMTENKRYGEQIKRRMLSRLEAKTRLWCECIVKLDQAPIKRVTFNFKCVSAESRFRKREKEDDFKSRLIFIRSPIRRNGIAMTNKFDRS